MVTFVSLNKDLDYQEKIEGVTENTKLVRKIIKFLKYSGDTRTFFNVKWYRYGELSYEAKPFRYVKPNMLEMFEHLKS